MANTEDIEAKLCAFVDGELDDAGKAEIQRHLATNPQHRRLLDELTQTRDYLRELPRAVAPPDILESLQGQLERAALLGDDAGASDTILKIGHWSQAKAIAAVLVLAVGLGAIFYFMLPSTHVPPPEVAMTTTAAPSPGSGRVTVSKGEAETRVEGKRLASRQVGDSLGALRGMSKSGEAREIVSNAISPEQQIFSNVLNLRGGEALALNGPVVHVVVSAPNPAAAVKQVSRYLEDKNVAITSSSTEEPPLPLNLGASQVGMGKKVQQETHVAISNEPDAAKDAAITGQSPQEPSQQSTASAAPMKEKSDQMQLQVQAQSPSSISARLRDEKHWVVARRMNRRDVGAMRDAIADPAANVVVQIEGETQLPVAAAAGQLSLNPSQAEPTTGPSSDAVAPMSANGGVANADRSLDFDDLLRVTELFDAPATQPADAMPMQQVQQTQQVQQQAQIDQDAPVDVVIVVRPEAALISGTTQPSSTTQPATEPSTPQEMLPK
jgi:hypothetical protein